MCFPQGCFPRGQRSPYPKLQLNTNQKDKKNSCCHGNSVRLATISSLRQAASLTTTGELEKKPIPVLYQSAIPHRPSQHFLRASSIFHFSWLRPSVCPSSALLSKARMQTHRSCLWYTDSFLLGLLCPRKLCK